MLWPKVAKISQKEETVNLHTQYTWAATYLLPTQYKHSKPLAWHHISENTVNYIEVLGFYIRISKAVIHDHH